MTAFAFLDADGIPTAGGMRHALPDGAVKLPLPFTTIDLPRLMFRDGIWSERPALPRAVAVEGGFTLDPLPDRAEIVVTDLGSGLQMRPAPIWNFTYPLPADGSFEIAVTGPRPWLASALSITRGTGSAVLAAARLARVRAAAVARINARTGQARLRVYTDIPGQDAIYLEKRAEAVAYVRSFGPADPAPGWQDDFPLLAGEIGPGLTATSAYELAQIWLNRAHQFKEIARATERARLRAAYAVALAPDDAAITAIEGAFEEALTQLPT